MNAAKRSRRQALLIIFRKNAFEADVREDCLEYAFPPQSLLLSGRNCFRLFGLARTLFTTD
jgi:hypothetical protein